MESRPFNDLFVQGMTNTKAREMLDSGYRMPAPEGTSDDMYNLMLRCWNYEAEARPHFKEIHSKIDILFSRYLRFFMNYLKTLGIMKKKQFRKPKTEIHNMYILLNSDESERKFPKPMRAERKRFRAEPSRA